MDLSSLAVILQAALSPNPDERKAAEQGLNQVRLSFRLLSNFGSDQSFDRFSLFFFCFLPLFDWGIFLLFFFASEGKD